MFDPLSASAGALHSRALPPSQPHVAAFPPVHERGNPYRRLSEAALAERGVTFVAAPGFPRPGWAARTPVDAVHLHWLEHLTHREGRLAAVRSYAAALRLVVALAILRLRGIGLVWTVHNLAPHDREPPGIALFTGLAVGRLAGALVVHSEAMRRGVARRFRRRRGVVVVGHPSYPLPGSDEPRAAVRERLGLSPDAYVYLAFGQLWPYKRVPDLVRAFRSLPEAGIALAVVGEPSDPRERAAVEQAAGRDPRVHLRWGHVTEPDVAAWHRAADAAVLNHRELLSSGALALALGAGLPAVVGDAGAATELGAGPAVVAAGPGGLAAALAEVRSGDAAARGAAAREATSRWTWERLAETVHGAYLGRPEGPRRRPGPLRPAILLSADSFEEFFEDQLGLDRRGYVERYRNDWAWDYCRALRAAGAEPLVYVASHRHRGRDETPDGFAVRFLPIGRHYAPWRVAPVLRRSPPGRHLGRAAAARSFLPALREGLADDGVAVLLVQEYWTGRFNVLAGRAGVPVIGVDQGLPDRREVKLGKRRAFARAAGVIVQTSAEAEKVRRHGGRPTLLPNAVDTDFFTPDPAIERDRSILVAARLHDPQKRISDLIEALARLPEPWRLDVAGRGPDEDALRRLAAERGLAGRVRWLGFEPSREAVRERLRACGVFALPSAFEGLPMALLEAMACGAAVVGSDIPAIAEVLAGGDAGLTVPVGRPDLLAEAIERAYADRERLGRAARNRSEQGFSQRRFGLRLAELLEVALAEGALPRL